VWDTWRRRHVSPTTKWSRPTTPRRGRFRAPVERADGQAYQRLPSSSMFLTQRQAAALIGERTGIARRAATRLLNAGLAGTPQRTSASLLYDRDQVLQLTDRAPVGSRESLPPECAGGVLLARTTATTDPLEAVCGPARMSLVTRALTRLMPPEGQGWYPVVVLMHHFVVAGAELLDVAPVPQGHPQVERARTWPGRPRLWEMRTRPPGAWFTAAFAGRVLATGAGNPYLLWALPDPPGAVFDARTKPPDAIC